MGFVSYECDECQTETRRGSEMGKEVYGLIQHVMDSLDAFKVHVNVYENKKALFMIYKKTVSIQKGDYLSDVLSQEIATSLWCVKV